MEQIERIKMMERSVDRASQAVMHLSAALDEYVEAQDALRQLNDYYGSDVWKHDFAADSSGLLPHDLKRGVLSEDAVWNLLEAIRDLQERMRETLFLCSKRTPINLYEYIFRWTDSLSERDCVACFNSTEMESEVLKALLVIRIPTILFVMNRFTDVNNIQIEQALKENRIHIVVLKRDESRGKGQIPRLRNELSFNCLKSSSISHRLW